MNEQKRMGRFQKTLILLLCVLLLVSFVLLIVLTAKVRAGVKNRPVSSTPGNAESRQPDDSGSAGESGSVQPPEETSQHSDVALGLTADAGSDYQNSIVFIGDSTTAHLRSRGVLEGGTDTKQVWCPSNNTLLLTSEIASLKIVYPDTGEELTIGQAAQAKKPAFVIVTVGINGVIAFSKNTGLFENCYQLLIDTIRQSSPDTVLMLQSVFPVSAGCDSFSVNAASVNECIDLINKSVRKLCRENGLHYLDTQSVLKGSDNMMLPEYDNGDGIHLTKNGYQVILEYIRTHVPPEWKN